MKRDKLFEECLANVDPEDREYVRTQMDYQLMGLPTDEELDEWYDYDAIAEASARYIRNLAAQKLKEQKSRYIDKACEWIEKNKYDVNDFAYDPEHKYMVVDVDSLMTYLKAMEG